MLHLQVSVLQPSCCRLEVEKLRLPWCVGSDESNATRQSLTAQGSCTSTGRKCDGYPKPKDTFLFQVFTPSEPMMKPQPVVSLVSGLGDSTRYLEFYHQCAVPSLASRFDYEFWSKTSLQMAHTESAVRHAVIALGYLNETESGSLKHARSKFQVVHGNKVFLYHYNQAVRKLVERMTEPSYSPEIGLVTCIIFVCIEFLRGNYCTGFTHMTNGLKLIHEWQQKKKADLPSLNLAYGKDSGSVIDDILLPMFQRGMTSAQLYGVPTEEHLDIPFPDPDCFIRLPFTLQEAERSSRELRNASVLYIRRTLIRVTHSIPFDGKCREQQAQLTECHRVWFERVQIAEDSQQWSRDELVALSALKVTLYATTTHIECSDTTLQVPFDRYLHTFRALVRHAEIVLDAMDLKSTHAAKFTFDMTLIPQLFHTATRCRCPTTRREAVALLSRGLPREGLWDAEQHALVARRAIEMEEREVDPKTGWPVERSRLYTSVIDANMDAGGGFWVTFVPSGWVFEVDASGKPRQILERFNM
ncbi:hypothetical protein OPT61_g3821 [Boeremia exigua]|uniref:Uncharacterized protein n=1 Tax=Boeremia exigua TaxID=749465 RepID=A0ACC2IGH7_9PLEO|nr:hypothetical protein OPT61_g3821 [Boeremia exigua]